MAGLGFLIDRAEVRKFVEACDDFARPPWLITRAYQEKGLDRMKPSSLHSSQPNAGGSRRGAGERGVSIASSSANCFQQVLVQREMESILANGERLHATCRSDRAVQVNFRVAKNNRSKSACTLNERKRLNNQAVWPVIFSLTGPICARAFKT
jgi:hypothetical protein